MYHALPPAAFRIMLYDIGHYYSKVPAKPTGWVNTGLLVQVIIEGCYFTHLP